jgi:hypothetical protein
MTVYKWILDGGLGFRPGKISLFGESAGTFCREPNVTLLLLPPTLH